VQDIQTSSSTSGPKTIFVGGKGGVGKTTVSSALAVSLASNVEEEELKVLIVSTDPAHSLGDALDVDLRSSHGAPVLLTDPVTGGRLAACEIDSTAALEEFRSTLEAFDIDRLADALGVSPELLEGFGLREFGSLLQNPPPGLDELVALANVLSLDGNDSKMAAAEYDVVIVDTAPTGHTLRLLALPKFLDGLLGKLIQIRMKLSGLVSTLQSLFGSSQEAAQRRDAIDTALQRLEEFQTKMNGLRARLQNDQQTNFIVVTIPTTLAVAESKRLMTELDSQGVTVTDVVVNQYMQHEQDDDDDDAKLLLYYERRKSGQIKWITELQTAIDDVSASPEFRENGNSEPIALTQVPFFDVELVGVPALAYLARECFQDNPSMAHLMGNNNNQGNNTKVLICGGKGGVGKTTTSSSMAVSMAAAGHNVALISTDPAHSLGDALDMDLSGGKLTDCPLIGVPSTEGSLSVMEIDPSEALGRFKSVVDDLVGSRAVGGGRGSSNDKMMKTLKDIGEIFDTLPAGADEVVALAKVVNLVKKGGFDRIVLDTAPTGHTLRMLSTPGFLADLMDRILKISKKINQNPAIKMLIASAASGEDMEAATAKAESTLLSFQLQMWDLEDLFSDPETTEFMIVTVPTELAVRESVRLLNDLTFEAPDMPIKVRNVVVNKVLSEDGSDLDTFVTKIQEGQSSSMQILESAIDKMAKKPEVTKVQYLDTEPRGVFGLKVLAEELLKDTAKETV
jgi:arsenite-transporting ATPase